MLSLLLASGKLEDNQNILHSKIWNTEAAQMKSAFDAHVWGFDRIKRDIEMKLEESR